MDHLFIEHFSVQQTESKVKAYFEEIYSLWGNNLNQTMGRFNSFTSELKDTLYVTLEYPYVDKTYRDTYYSYFSSKLDAFPRNSIRLSFFIEQIPEAFFRDRTKVSELQEKYLGFLVVRPTFPKVIGRNVIHPDAFKNVNHVGCKVSYNSTVNFIKLRSTGFPHSSQDGETISCAETTVWSILEYFGNKYPESLVSDKNRN